MSDRFDIRQKIGQTFCVRTGNMSPGEVAELVGDPYKLYEMPYVPNYINAYSNTPSSQRAVVKVWLGEMAARGAVPVECPGFFANTTHQHHQHQ